MSAQRLNGPEKRCLGYDQTGLLAILADPFVAAASGPVLAAEQF